MNDELMEDIDKGLIEFLFCGEWFNAKDFPAAALRIIGNGGGYRKIKPEDSLVMRNAKPSPKIIQIIDFKGFLAGLDADGGLWLAKAKTGATWVWERVDTVFKEAP